MIKKIFTLGFLGFITSSHAAQFEIDPYIAGKYLPTLQDKVVHRVNQGFVVLKPNEVVVDKDVKKRSAIFQKNKTKAKAKQNRQKVITDPTFVLKGVELVGSHTNYEHYNLVLEDLVDQLLGTEVTLAKVVAISRALEAQYQRDGHLFYQVIVPMQKFNADQAIVKFEVLEIPKGFVEKVSIQGEMSESTRSILENYGNEIVAQKSLDERLLQRNLLLARDLPGVEVDAKFSQSVGIDGATQITYFATEDNSPRGYISHNNRGTSYVGRGLVTLGLSKPNLIINDELSGSASVSLPRRDQLLNGKLHYKTLVGNAGSELHAGMSKTVTKPGFTLTPLRYEGNSRSFEAFVNHPLKRSVFENIYIRAGANWSDSDLEQKSISKRLYMDSVRNLFIAVNYDTKDNFEGLNNLEFKITRGLKVFGASKTREKHLDIISLSRAQGRTNNLRLNAFYERIQPLVGQVSAMIAFNGQYSNKSLLALEQFGFGGEKFGRGYDQSALIGDSGVAGIVELRHDLEFYSCTLPMFQSYAFYDVGRRFNKDRTYLPAVRSASSAGLGLRFVLRRYLDGGLEVNKALTHPLTVERNKNPRIFYYITANF